MTDWDDVLDAVEEHLRRAELVIRGELDDVEPLQLPGGQIPAEHATRLLVLLQRGRDLELLAKRRQVELEREMTYTAR